MDYFIITVITLAGLVFHAWLFVRFRRWADRDLAISLAGNDPKKREWALVNGHCNGSRPQRPLA